MQVRGGLLSQILHLPLSLVFIGCNRVITVITTPPTLNTARFFCCLRTFLFYADAFHANAIDPGHKYGNFPLLLRDIKATSNKLYTEKGE